jgi:hypothetical protein
MTPPYETTFWHLLGTVSRGEYRVDQSLTIYLDVDALRASGQYEEVRAHEETHLQLTTSTTIGHALMFLASSELVRHPVFESLFDALMKVSWEAQEGAATVTEWFLAERRDEHLDEARFIAGLPEQYKEPFDVFNTVVKILLHPDSYWMRPVLANALAQFFLNTDILQRLNLGFQGKEGGTEFRDYFDAVENHPQRRRLAVMSALGEANSDLRMHRCEEIAADLARIKDALERVCPGSIKGDTMDLACMERSQVFQLNDLLNQTFLRYFSRITSLPIGALHASEAAEQINQLVRTLEQVSGQPILFNHFDMSRNLQLRTEFKPEVIDIRGGELQ